MAETEGNTRNFSYILQKTLRISNRNFNNFCTFYLSRGNIHIYKHTHNYPTVHEGGPFLKELLLKKSV